MIERMGPMSQTQDKSLVLEETNTADFWDDLYGRDISPWDTGKPDRFLQEVIVRLGLPQGAEVLDIGCGTGTNAIWLAQRGFRVTGVDLSTIAIDRAKAKASSANVQCNFFVADVLSAPHLPEAFDFAFDLGCFHQYEVASNRMAFGRTIARLLKPGGKLLSISGSTDGPAFEYGPPRRSAREIVEALEPHFRFMSLSSAFFDRGGSEQSRAWICLMDRR
jgi:SAM-dependent methyltransferase